MNISTPLCFAIKESIRFKIIFNLVSNFSICSYFSTIFSCSFDNPDLLKQFKTGCKQLVLAPDITVRQSATRLLGGIEHTDAPGLQRRDGELAGTYNLVIPPISVETVGSDDLPKPGQPLPDSTDPRVVVRPFNSELAVIAKLARLSETGVFARVVQIMNALRPFDEWSAVGEQRLRSTLDAAGLKFSFVRPRTSLVRRAMFHVVAELYDARVFNLDVLNQLEPILRNYDPSMLAREPGPRPAEVELLSVGPAPRRRTGTA